MPNAMDLTGKKFSRLQVIGRNGSTKWGKSVWTCICICGRELDVPGGDLTSGNTRSCGCLNSDIHRKHGKHGSREYVIWSSMLQRCTNTNHESYHNYGGRGISVCNEWLNFSNFFSDMGNAPAGKTLDRIDNEKGYSPKNCKWSDRYEQRYNTRMMRRNKTGMIGISKTKNGTWYAQLVRKGRPILRKKFKTKLEAENAYKTALENWMDKISDI